MLDISLNILLGFFELFFLFAGKFKKQRSYEHNSLFEAVMLSIENLNDYHKKLYKQLAVFLDDVGIPPKVFFIFTNLRLSMSKMTFHYWILLFLKLTHIKKRASKILNTHFKIWNLTKCIKKETKCSIISCRTRAIINRGLYIYVLPYFSVGFIIKSG